ncbi:hypothetical protein FNV43_RR17702 [Rhamnella rubrinervis]|uniref:Uncharacterized protein n=1 Tax=Rhamnella rubrinervis TaxID=2594499 RepID=A0A8K0E491_9ROSA|nr:hypothetical protein FNV43_RR17702 [Rhamnella rubrinervis]
MLEGNIFSAANPFVLREENIGDYRGDDLEFIEIVRRVNKLSWLVLKLILQRDPYFFLNNGMLKPSVRMINEVPKIEQEKLEKLARKGPKPEEPAASSGGSVTDSKTSGSTSAGGASTERVSTDKYRNYAVVAGVVTGLGALGWYLKSNAKKPEVQD